MSLTRPARLVSTLVATISVHDGTIAVSLPDYEESFADAVRALGYNWQAPRWQRTVPAAALLDRVAELGHHLLLAGYPVDFPDEATRDRAVAGDFAAECQRWVRTGRGQYAGWLALAWHGRDRALYDKARELPGSRYDGDTYSVVIPPEQHAAVVAFARAAGYRVTIVKVAPPADVCLERCRADPARPRSTDWAPIIARWFRVFEPVVAEECDESLDIDNA